MQEKSLRVDLERWTSIIVGFEGSVQGNRGSGPRFPDFAIASPSGQGRAGGSTRPAGQHNPVWFAIAGDLPLPFAGRASDDRVRGGVPAKQRVAIALDHTRILTIRAT